MLLDTSVLVELLRRPATDPWVKALLARQGDAVLFASPIHLGELSDAARRSGLDPQPLVDRALQVVELVPLDANVAVLGSQIKAEARTRPSGRDFSLIDGVGLASARTRGLRMLTCDREFEGFSDVTVLAR